MKPTIESLEHRHLMAAHFTAAVNFAPLDAPRAPGMLTDYGSTYGHRRGGVAYGWSGDMSARAVDRNLAVSVTQRNDTFIAMQKPGSYGRTWELGVPEEGQYRVYLVAGDPGAPGDRMAISVEGTLAIAGQTTARRRWLEGSSLVYVTDGRLTVSSASGDTFNKLNYIVVQRTTEPVPTLGITAPSAFAHEGGTRGRFEITRTGDTSGSLTVPLFVSGTATNAIDYGRIGKAVTFAPGVSTISLPVAAPRDGQAEESETIIVSLALVQGYQLGFNDAQVTLVDGDQGQSGKAISWVSKSSAPTAKSGSFGGAVGGKLYVFGGYFDDSGKPVTSARVYDPAVNAWADLAPLSANLADAAQATDDRYVYFAGGHTTAGAPDSPAYASNKLIRYDTLNNTYAELPALPESRAGGAMALLGTRLYFAGGTNLAGADAAEAWSLDLLDMGTGWSAIAGLPVARSQAGAVALNGYVYLVGGQSGSAATPVPSSTAWRYHPGSDTWQTIAALPAGRSQLRAATILHDGRIITLGGLLSGDSVSAAVLSYDPSSNKWSTMQSLPAARYSGVAAVVDADRLLYSGGYNNGYRNNTYLGTLA